MEKEISNGTMLGIVLIALAVIIALGFGIFSIGKGTANEGVNKVQDQLMNVQVSEFTDFDQKIVTGTQVKSALSNFEGKSVAILIGTSALRDAVAAYDYDGSDIYNGSAGKTLAKLPIIRWSGTTVGSETNDSQVNYNALLKIALEEDAETVEIPDGEEEVDDDADVGVISFNSDSGKYRFTGTFAVKGGIVQLYTSIGDINKTGMTEYINPGSKFNANLIEDASGTIVGVVFNQLSSN